MPDSAGITKPFHYPELLARIGAVLARVSRSRDRQVIRHGELAVNTLSREVTVNGYAIDLSAKEYQLLTTLASEPGQVFTKRLAITLAAVDRVNLRSWPRIQFRVRPDAAAGLLAEAPRTDVRFLPSVSKGRGIARVTTGGQP